MMRGLPVLIVLAVVAMLAACEERSRPDADPGARPTCDSGTRDCRGEAGQEATVSALPEVEDFGIAATFSEGVWVCPSFSNDAVRGYFTRVGLETFDCLDKRAPGTASSYGVRASWNAAYAPTLDEIRGETRPCRSEAALSAGPGGRPYAIRGVDTRVCVDRLPDGWILIEVEGTTGESTGLYEGDAPHSIYTAWLETDAVNLARDSALFEQFLDRLIIASPDKDCGWRRGRLVLANGNPTLRIILPNRRILGVQSADDDESLWLLPPVAREAVLAEPDRWGVDFDGDWRVCARDVDRPGVMQPVEIVDARDLRVVGR